MQKNKKGLPKVKHQEEQPPAEEVEKEPESEMSQQDDDAALLTSKVEEKLLSTLAKIKMKDPSIYDKSKQNLFQQSDFDDEQQADPVPQAPNNNTKFTYKQMIKSGAINSEEEENQVDLPLAVEQKRAKQKFKNALKQNMKKIEESEGDLFQIAKKLTKKEEEPAEDQKTKFKELTKKFDKESKKLIKKVWKSDQMDETDLFLKNYILDKKWLSSKYKQKEDAEQEAIDEEDEERSLEMDAYEAQYNFRFEEPGGTTITQYPREVQNSLRQKPQTRKEKRKKTIERKKQEELELRKEAEEKQKTLKKQIIQKLVPESNEADHDWFFCDDCCRPFSENDVMWQCSECQDYMLCEECYEIIIHKHSMNKGKVPKGFGAPSNCQNALQQLKTCKVCRRKIPTTKNRYQWTDRSYIVNIMCQECYDSSNLEIKKKYKLIEAESPNIEQILDHNPEKIKQLTNQKEIQEMVDEYIKNDFEGVISGGLKTKFRYINVPAESYGLSDEQILYGDDKELNKYVSVKRLAPYSEDKLRLKNSIFNKKIKSIKKSVKTNKQLIKKGVTHLNKAKLIARMKTKATAIRQRREKRLRILNLSNTEKERDHFVSSSRLLSYGIKNQIEEEE